MRSGYFTLAIVFGNGQSRMKVRLGEVCCVKNLVSNLISVRGRTGELQVRKSQLEVSTRIDYRTAGESQHVKLVGNKGRQLG